MFKILIVIFVAVAAAFWTHKLDLRTHGIELIVSLIAACLCLILLIPCTETKPFDKYSLNTMDDDVIKIIPCEHIDCKRSLEKVDAMKTTVYDTFGASLLYGSDRTTSYIIYCPKCYTDDSARSYFKSRTGTVLN